jgi:hypothetical protein
VKAVVWYDGKHPAADFRLRAGGLNALRRGAADPYYKPPLKVAPAS